MPTRLPPEIIHFILRQLALDKDVASLKTCASVCRDFLEICHSHIFHKINLSDSVQPHSRISSVRQYKRAFEASPRLASNVRSVKYFNEVGVVYTVPVLQWLHRVHTFSFGFRNSDQFHEDQQNWNQIPTRLIQSLCYFIQSNHITNLHLRSISNIPIDVFFHFPGLTHLKLVDITLSKANSGKKYSPPGTIARIQNLSINDALAAITTLTKRGDAGQSPVLSLEDMEEFLFNSNFDTAGVTSAIGRILSSSNCLTSVEIRGPEINFLGQFAKYISEESLQRLKRITLILELEAFDDPYQNFVKELEQMPGLIALEELEFNLCVETDRICNTAIKDWIRLDDLCSQMGRFPRLRRVHIFVKTFSLCKDYTALHSTLNDVIGPQAFQQIRSNDKIDFIFSVVGRDI